MENSQRKAEPILQFKGLYQWLSNFHKCKILYEGLEYTSTEHAYMAAKVTDQAIRLQIQALPTSREARNFGQTVTLREGWEDLKFGVMLEVNRRKYFDTPYLGERLLATGDAYLCEGTTWGDRYWGVDPVGSDNGQNNLGKILMQIREELKNAKEAQETST